MKNVTTWIVLSSLVLNFMLVYVWFDAEARCNEYRNALIEAIRIIDICYGKSIPPKQYKNKKGIEL
jgi:hypothetical protein